MNKLFFVALLFGCLLAAASGVPAAPLKMVSTNVMPWGYLNAAGKPAGLHVQILTQLGRSSGLDYQLKVEPYPRVVRDIQLGRADVSIMFDSAESRAMAHFLAPVELGSVFLVGHKDVSWNQLLAKPKLRIGRMGHSNYGLAKLKLAAKNFVAINTVSQGVAMMLRGRLDGVVCTSSAFSLALEKLKVDSVNSLQAFHLTEINGAVFLSKRSRVKPEQLQRAAKAAVKKIGVQIYHQGRNLDELTLVDIE